MPFEPMRFIPVCFAALLLAGCANTGGATQGAFGGPAPRPKTVLVSDFVFSSDVVAVDRGFTTRLERKVGHFPTHERKQRTNERVNDEIVAAIVASLREAGIEAQPGNEEGLLLGDDAIVIGGRLRANDPAAAKKNQIGFGAGRGGTVADMTVVHFSSNGKKQLTAFAAESGKRPGAPSAGKLAASRNAAIAASLAAANAATEKLSPDVEAQARGLGRVAGEKLVAFAKEQGWLAKGESAEAALDDKPARLPASRPERKPAQPDAAEKPDG